MMNGLSENFGSAPPGIPLWEETMRRLTFLSSPESFADEFNDTVDITETMFQTSKPFCDDANLNSEGNSPASSLDESEKQKQDRLFETNLDWTCRYSPKLENNTECDENNNKNNLHNLHCSYLTSITSKDIIRVHKTTTEAEKPPCISNDKQSICKGVYNVKTECYDDIVKSDSSSFNFSSSNNLKDSSSFCAVESEALTFDNLSKPCELDQKTEHDKQTFSCDNVNCNNSIVPMDCFVNLGVKISNSSMEKFSSDDCSHSRDAYLLNHFSIKSCSVVLHDLIHSKDKVIRKTVRRQLRKKEKCDWRKKRKHVKKLKKAAKITDNQEHCKKPRLSTSRWLNIWKEGNSQLNAELNFIHVTRNTVRSLQEIVHHDQ